jgi:hypothetical protein
MKMEYMMASRVAALQGIALHPASPLPRRDAARKSGRDPWYLRGLRPIENETELFVKNDFIWLGY